MVPSVLFLSIIEQCWRCGLIPAFTGKILPAQSQVIDKTHPKVYIIKCKLNVLWGQRMRATAKDLRFHSKELINTVNRGEEVVITFRGKPCAKLVPFEEKKSKKNKGELFGMWKNYKLTENVDEYVRDLRKGRFQW